MLHVETLHSEGDSPFLARDSDEPEPGSKGQIHAPLDSMTVSPNGVQDEYVECHVEGCGETLLLSEVAEHLDMHTTETTTLDGPGDEPKDDEALSKTPELSDEVGLRFSTRLPECLRNYDGPSQSDGIHHHGTRHRRKEHNKHETKDWSKLLHAHKSLKSDANPIEIKGRTKGRLGKAELGPYAHEVQMPAWLLTQLNDGAKITVYNQLRPDGTLSRVEKVANETRGLLPVIAQLSLQDASVVETYVCHPSARHIYKMFREGSFCGYRNIQMLVSYIQGARAQGCNNFGTRTPSIPQLQEMIEQAWDMGINSSGRIETGGIRGTRKYIGTPEAQALCLGSGIGCSTDALGKDGRTDAHKRLLSIVEDYFASGCDGTISKLHKTFLPPIYFQFRGHSLTIIGLEKRKDGSRNLLVFDPSFKTSPGICRLIDTTFKRASSERLLKPHRRGEVQLRKHSEFELLKYVTVSIKLTSSEPVLHADFRRLTARVQPSASWDSGN
ncbi:MAG: hypothetical protein M1812_002238 [Candelaria pacifica]|nr:MAG: hypothetical protein M1812_002238 [Candelaria pacifica]